MGVSAAVSAYGAYSEGQAGQAMSDYNAKVARMKAESEATAIEAEATLQRDEARSRLGALRAEGGGRGVEIETGSPLLSMAEASKGFAFDQMELQRQADTTRTLGIQQGKMMKYEGNLKAKAANIRAIGEGVKGASNMVGAYKSAPKKPSLLKPKHTDTSWKYKYKYSGFKNPYGGSFTYNGAGK